MQGCMQHHAADWRSAAAARRQHASLRTLVPCNSVHAQRTDVGRLHGPANVHPDWQQCRGPSSSPAVLYAATRPCLSALPPPFVGTPRKCGRPLLAPCRASASSAAPNSGGQVQVRSLEQSANLALTISTVATVGLSAALVAAPATAFRQTLAGCPTAATRTLLQHVGVSAWPIAAILWVLADAARNQRLSSDTYQRLASYIALGCGGAAVYSAAALGGLGLGWHNPAATKSIAFLLSAVPGAGAVAAISAGLKANDASSSWAGSQATALRGAWQKLTAANKGAEGTLYQALAFLLPLGMPLLVYRSALGGWLWPLPEAVQRLGLLHGVLLKKLALQAVGAAVAAFSLKDAENRGRLGGGTFRLLRAALGAAALGHGLIALQARSAAASTANQIAYGGLAALTAAVVLKWATLEARRSQKK